MLKLLDLLFGLEGRIDRGTWWGVRILGILYVLIPLGAILVATTPTGQRPTGLVGLLSAAVCAVTAWVELATTVKRWHDRDKSGWMYFIRLIPLIGPIWTLVECGFLAGTPGPNRYGLQPTDEGPVEVTATVS